MRELIEKARTAASQLFDDVVEIAHVETQPTGVAVFAVARRAGGSVTVSLNPNGRGAGVEWRCPTRGTGYRTFKLQGLVQGDVSP